MASPTLVQNRWLNGIPWTHYTGRAGGNDGIDAALGHGPSGNQATFTIIVDWFNFQNAVVQLCGQYFWSSGGGPMTRYLPKQHPAIPWLYVGRIVGVKPMIVTSKDFTLEPGNWSNYRYVMITIVFTQPKYALLTDQALDKAFPQIMGIGFGGANVRQEWRRYMEMTPKIGVETLSIEAGQYKYAEGTGAGGQPLAGTTSVAAPILKPLSKGSVLGVWRNVPVYGLISPTTYQATYLNLAVGTVNSVAYPDANGYPIGTLLFQGYDISYNEAPYDPSLFLAGLDGANQGVNQFIQSTTADVSLCWSFFDPPHSHSAYRGHNLVPYRSDPDGSWYLISVDGNPAHDRIVPTYDHRLIFQGSM